MKTHVEKNQEKLPNRQSTDIHYTRTHPYYATIPSIHQIQTHQNITTTAAKKAIHAFQPTPVLLAMRSIFFIVPCSFSRVPSNLSFIASISVVELRTSSPIATVIYPTH